jgi:tRNA A37 threonylcarbamoyladenosine biosynthesis protein TsaE
VRSVKNAMQEYLQLKRPETPLAVAVFGPPGAGKSFAIKEIAKHMGIDKDAQLTFNLS